MIKTYFYDKEKLRNKNLIFRLISTLPLLVYFICLIWPLHLFSTYSAALNGLGSFRSLQIAGVLSFLSLVLFIWSSRRRNERIIYNKIWIGMFIVFNGWCLLSFGWSILPLNSFIYSILLMFTVVACLGFWVSIVPMQKEPFLLPGVLIIILFLYLSTILPIRDRTLGWIQPNLIGHYGMFLVVIGLTLRKYMRTIFILVGLGVIYWAEARTVSIATFSMVIIYFLFTAFTKDKSTVTASLIMLILLGVVIAMIGLPMLEFLQNTVNELLGITNVKRTGGAGFSGRTDLWEEGLELANSKIITGYGFRTRLSILSKVVEAKSAHSGVVNLLLDLGLVGFILYLALYFTSIFSLAYNAIGEEGTTYSKLGFSFLVSNIPNLIIEPNYINFAHPTSFAVLLFFSLGAVKGIVFKKVKYI